MTYLTYVGIAQVIVIHLHILIIHAYPSETRGVCTYSAMGGAGSPVLEFSVEVLAEILRKCCLNGGVAELMHLVIFANLY